MLLNTPWSSHTSHVHTGVMAAMGCTAKKTAGVPPSPSYHHTCTRAVEGRALPEEPETIPMEMPLLTYHCSLTRCHCSLPNRISEPARSSRSSTPEPNFKHWLTVRAPLCAVLRSPANQDLGGRSSCAGPRFGEPDGHGAVGGSLAAVQLTRDRIDGA